ncbi:MAG: MliC family protein [Plesiomonas shigelloides]
MKRSAGLFILGICSMPVLAHTPVIDCKTSSGSVEKLICSDPALAALDQKMAKVYQEAVAKGTDSAWLKATQRGWIKGRNECWKSSDLPACTRQNYQLRIAELQVKYQLSQPLAPVVYSCKGRPDPVTVTFYNETKPQAANITLDSSGEPDSQVVSFIQPSGSGIRYGGVNTQYDVLFWGKGEAAALTINGTEYACQVSEQTAVSSTSKKVEATPASNTQLESTPSASSPSKSASEPVKSVPVTESSAPKAPKAQAEQSTKP